MVAEQLTPPSWYTRQSPWFGTSESTAAPPFVTTLTRSSSLAGAGASAAGASFFPLPFLAGQGAGSGSFCFDPFLVGAGGTGSGSGTGAPLLPLPAGLGGSTAAGGSLGARALAALAALMSFFFLGGMTNLLTDILMSKLSCLVRKVKSDKFDTSPPSVQNVFIQLNYRTRGFSPPPSFHLNIAVPLDQLSPLELPIGTTHTTHLSQFISSKKFFQLYQFQAMEKDKRLFSKKKIKGGNILLTSTATRDPVGEIKVEISQLGLEEKSGNGWSSIFFDFDVKFSFTVSPPTVKFERNEEVAIFKLKSSEEVQKWREVLKDYLNQRGFHEQFKPFKKIGKGNFATVYLVEKIEDQKNYAVKAFSKEAAYSEEKGKECLIKEIEVMRHLNHKNCMKLYEVFESENSLYIVFELLEGGQLYDKVKSKYRFKSHEVMKIVRGILLGLREMHSKNIMHRDLKPENLLFRKTGDWDCVIADFGLAQFSEEPEYLFVRCGTPGYVAPEVINIKDMSTKYKPICDIFSLGLIFYLLLIGKSAFPGKTYNEVLSQNRAAVVSLFGDQFSHIPPTAIDLLEKMLKKNPEARISAEDALRHPYFENSGANLAEQEEEHSLSHKKSDSYSTECDSPLLTSANPKRRVNKSLKKDSCVDFKMAKENLMTGKTDTVNGISSKISGFNHDLTTAKKPKVSQFSANKNN